MERHRSHSHKHKKKKRYHEDSPPRKRRSEDYRSHDDAPSTSGHVRQEKGQRKEKERRFDVTGKEVTVEDPDEISTAGLADNFNWEGHRRTLDRIFFKDDAIFKRGSQELEDFWNFFKKFQKFQQKKAQSAKNSIGAPVKAASSKFDLPSNYDKRYRMNIAISSKELRNRIEQHNLRIASEPSELTSERVAEFKTVLLHYMDFAQKQKFTKLVKIRHDQQNLPIFQFRDNIIEAVNKYQVIVVAGDTGCGKSTQVPQYLLQAGFTNIACTQPRRIACISLSKRVSYETLNEYGSEVAYQVRFEKSRTKNSRIIFLTEGLLLRQITGDSMLSQYNVIVVDEVHERHIHTDFLLGVIKCILHQRKDLKLVLMSATINLELFTNYFDNCPVVKVPGRLYPIELKYFPISAEDKTSRSERLDPSPYIRILTLIDKTYPKDERGDVLMFLSGMTEIMAVVEAAKMYAEKSQQWIILPLHSALSIAEQDKVFDFPPDGVRKCIVSTNIAETSVTIDGVRFVVDSGKVKEMSFDTKFKLQKLQEFWISRASAEQRKGRAGRTGPGVCFRLYGESDYNELQPYSTPEIHRVPLDSLVLQMVAMGMPDTRKFPFIEPPPPATVETSISVLKDLSALTPDEELTALGEMLAELPVDVVIGKMLIMASVFEMVDPVLSIAAALSVQSPFTSNAHRDPDAMGKRKPLESDHGDPITLLNAFDEWIQMKAEGEDTRRWCRRRGLEQQRFYEMMKLKQQFQQLLQDHGLLSNDSHHEPVTAFERQKKHADKKRLRQLKLKHSNQSKRRKMLKMKDHDFQLEKDSDEEQQESTEGLHNNIKDLEFKISHDLNELQEKSNRSRHFTLKDISMLKVILCSGILPQAAIADEHNSFKSDSEQTFHTKEKGFVLLHPTSVFAVDPEVLRLKEKDIKEKPFIKEKLSNRHQLITYVSLLETTKPYLVGAMRVPALPSLLLFSSQLDTNADCTCVVCDGWLEICFEDEKEAELMMRHTVQLRATWSKLILTKLHARGQHQGVDIKTTGNRETHILQKNLSRKLAQFLHADVYYTLRRLLAADMKVAYVGPNHGHGKSDAEVLGVTGGKPHPYKGGIMLTSYLTYNCLATENEGSNFVQNVWTCPQCNKEMAVTLGEKLHHEEKCITQQHEKEIKEELMDTRDRSLDPLRKDYHCDKCGKDFKFTTAEILKHKKNCKPP